jgi:hypothetical protein
MIKTKEILEEIWHLQNQIEEGDENPLHAYTQFDILEKAIKEAREAIRDTAIVKAEMYGEKKFNAFGVTVEVSGKTTWEYKHIPEWNKKKKELSEIEETSKSIRLNMDKGLIVATSDGEEAIPAISKYSQFLKITV